jgi:hypothetical protein
MTQTITIEMDDVSYKAFEYVANTPTSWTKNNVDNRVRKAKEEIIALLVAHCNDNNIALAVGQDAQVEQAFDLGIVETAAQRHSAFLEEAPE